MATDHRGNSINNNNLPKTTKDRIFEGSNFGPQQEGEPTDTQYMDAEMYFAEKREYPDMDEEMDEDPEQIRRAEQYAQEMYDYHKPLPSDRVYGKNEMIEHDRDDDKY